MRKERQEGTDKNPERWILKKDLELRKGILSALVDWNSGSFLEENMYNEQIPFNKTLCLWQGHYHEIDIFNQN